MRLSRHIVTLSLTALLFVGAGCGGSETVSADVGTNAVVSAPAAPEKELLREDAFGFTIFAQGGDCGDYWTATPATHDSPQGAIAWYDLNHGDPATAWFFYAVMPKKVYEEMPADWAGKPNLVEDLGRGVVLTRFTPPEKPADAPADCTLVVRHSPVVPRPSPTKILFEDKPYGFRVVAVGASCGSYFSGGSIRQSAGVTAYPVMTLAGKKPTEWFAYRVMTKAALAKIDAKKSPGRPDTVLELANDSVLTMLPPAKTPVGMPAGCILEARPMVGG